MTLEFLTLEEVLAAHDATLRKHGGTAGTRDMGALQSALAMPASGFGDQYFHSTIWEMAAAYAYHISQNHPFVDGNKRTGILAALTFLELNGYEIIDSTNKLHAAMVEVSSGRGSKAQLAVLLESLSTRPPT